MADQSVRVLLIGLDGADYELVSALMAGGELPNLQRLANEGVFRPLVSCIQPFTPVAWNCIYTGCNPGKHGVFNFSANDRRDPSGRASSRSRKATPFWRFLNQAGLSTVLVNLPLCYPAEPVTGAMVSGYGGPEAPDIYPAEVAERLREAFPDYVHSYHPIRHRYWEDFPAYIEKVCTLAGEHTAATSYLAGQLRPALAMVIHMCSDEVAHLAYHHHDRTHPAYTEAPGGRDPIVTIYQQLDTEVQRLVEAITSLNGEPPTVLVISDHGSQPIHRIFSLNQWLHAKGYLRFKKKRADNLRLGWTPDGVAGRVRRSYKRIQEGLDRRGLRWLLDVISPGLFFSKDRRYHSDAIDWQTTTAYAWGSYGQLWVAERMTGPGEKEEILGRLQADLAELRGMDGGPLFDVYLPGDLYSGPESGRSADLNLMPREPTLMPSASCTWSPGDEYLATLSRVDRAKESGFSGWHSMQGIFLAAGPMVKAAAGSSPGQAPFSLLDIAPSILHVLGCPVPESMDGRILHEVFAKPGNLFPTERVADAGIAEAETPLNDKPYTEEEEEAITERLRALGYL